MGLREHGVRSPGSIKVGELTWGEARSFQPTAGEGAPGSAQPHIRAHPPQPTSGVPEKGLAPMGVHMAQTVMTRSGVTRGLHARPPALCWVAHTVEAVH